MLSPSINLKALHYQMPVAKSLAGMEIAPAFALPQADTDMTDLLVFTLYRQY